MPRIESHFLEGKGSTLVITFNEMWNHYHEQRFWGEGPLKKIGFPAFGITSDGPHWYPEYETYHALREPVKMARFYDNVVLYGYSMGGYAALKYSWLFNNPIVLSFSPQYSIDPIDIGDDDTRYTDFFNPEYKVRHISSLDTNGRGYIFYDPTYAADNAHVSRISAPQRCVPLPHCGHETIQCISSTEALYELISAAVHDNYAKVKKIVRDGRKKNPFFAKYLLLNAINRDRIKFAARVAIELKNAVFLDAEVCAIAADAQKKVGDYAEALAFYRQGYALSQEQKYRTWMDECAFQLSNSVNTDGSLLDRLREKFRLS